MRVTALKSCLDRVDCSYIRRVLVALVLATAGEAIMYTSYTRSRVYNVQEHRSVNGRVICEEEEFCNYMQVPAEELTSGVANQAFLHNIALGMKVVLHSLQRVELNGLEGEIVSFDHGTMRVGVKIDARPKVMAVKPINLRERIIMPRT